jgi:hypothetical protein
MASPLQHGASYERLGVNPNVTSNTGDATSPGGLNAAAAKWTVVCSIPGSDEISIEADPDATVHDLKVAIKTAKQPEFSGFDAHRLTLYYVNISMNDNVEEEIKALNLTSRLMRGGRRLRTSFFAPPEVDFVHVFVKPPPSPPSEFLRAGIRRMTG